MSSVQTHAVWQMNICELHISVYERLDTRTLEHVQADEGRCSGLQPLIAHLRRMRRCSKRRLQF